MLRGHVFKEQIFGNQIFALFINTFLNGANGVSNNYKNGMEITYNNSIVTIDSGAVCVQGRFLEEDTSTDISAGTDNNYCKLVIEIDLDKQNSEGELAQATYKILKSSSNYPELTQSNIVKNNAGIYQYELARFKTSSNGITDFEDKRAFLDFESIYTKMQEEYRSMLEDLEQELGEVEDGTAYMLKNKFAKIETDFVGPSFEQINYPDGFNMNNTIIIGWKVKKYNAGEEKWYDGYYSGPYSGNKVYFTLKENYIEITGEATDDGGDKAKYVLELMKID